jgi:protein ImuB
MMMAEATTLARQKSGGKGSGFRVQGSGSAQSQQIPNSKSQIPNSSHSALEILPADPTAESDVLIRLAYWCHRYSPTVGLEEAERPESLLLDVTGIGRLFGGEEHLLEQAARALSGRGYRARLAIADTIGAAWALAHYGESHHRENKSQIPNPQSPIPNPKFQIPNSKFQIPNLPLPALRLPAETSDLLAQLGIHRVGELAALPREGLESRFGPLLLKRLDQALGTADEIFQPLHPPPDLSAEWSFETPTAEPGVIQAVIEKLLVRLVQGLTASGRGATALTCRLDVQDRPPLVVDVGLYRPTATAKHLHELIGMQLEQRRSRNLGEEVERVTVTILTAAPLVERQQELFTSEHSCVDPAALARLVDRLAGRLGHRGVVRPRLVRDAQPELAIQYEPLVGAKGPSNIRASAKQPRRSVKAKAAKLSEEKRDAVRFAPLERPLLLLPEPAPIRVISLLPDGPPAQFVYRGRTYRVARHWGPERIETGWWRKAGIRRDYWRTETTSGARYWLFRRLGDLAWFLHGVF